MSSLNKVMLIGNAGRDPETRTFPSGDKQTTFSIATTEKWKDKQSGEVKEATEWHRLVLNGRTAEVAEQYVRKGSAVHIEGSIRSRNYKDKDGAEKTAVEIRVDKMILLGGRPASGGAAPAPAARAPAAAPRAPAPRQQSTADDDIPF